MAYFTKDTCNSGYSFYNDPQLGQLSRNYEFRYTCPDQIDQAIQRFHERTAAQNAANAVKEKQPVKFVKIKHPGKDVNDMFKSRDQDVETQLSLDHRTCINVRALSSKEVHNLIQSNQRREISEKWSADAAEDSEDNILEEKLQSSLKVNEVHNEMELNPEKTVDSETESAHTPLSTTELFDKNGNEIYHCIVEEYPKLKAQWVDIVQTASVSELIIVEVTQPMNASMTMPASEALAYEFMMRHCDCCQKSMSEHYAEDSDLAYELQKRSEYTKYCQPKPRNLFENNSQRDDDALMPIFVEMEDASNRNISYLKNTASMRFTELTEDTVSESKYRVQLLLQSLDDMHAMPDEEMLTECCHRMDHKRLCAGKSSTYCQKHGHTRPAKKQPSYEVKEQTDSDFSQHSKKESEQQKPGSKSVTRTKKPQKGTKPKSVRKKPKPAEEISPIPSPAKHKKKTAANSDVPFANATDSRASHAGTKRTSTVSALRKTKPKTLMHVKLMEDLEMEKIAIYNKLTTSHERIIVALDQLRAKLLEAKAPEGNYEKMKRQRNALEFTVRFSRNFLYPLKGMIDDFRFVPTDAFNNPISNAAFYRIASIFSLIYQSLQAYQRQLRYFLLDKVPQKLGALIELIYTLTIVCTEKKVFKKHDACVECLQERCTKFLGFLEDLQEEKFMTCKQVNQAHNNLKLLPKELKVSEQKTLPKTYSVKRKQTRKQTQHTAPQQTQTKPNKDEQMKSKIKTQIEDVYECASYTCLESHTNTLDFSQDMKKVPKSMEPQTIHNFQETSNDASPMSTARSMNTKPLNDALIEALKLVTKDQVRKVLQPIIKSLDSMLEKRMDSDKDK